MKTQKIERMDYGFGDYEEYTLLGNEGDAMLPLKLHAQINHKRNSKETGEVGFTLHEQLLL